MGKSWKGKDKWKYRNNPDFQKKQNLRGKKPKFLPLEPDADVSNVNVLPTYDDVNP